MTEGRLKAPGLTDGNRPGLTEGTSRAGAKHIRMSACSITHTGC